MSSGDGGVAAFNGGNHVFHEAYGEARDGVRHEAAILVVLNDALVLHRQGERRSFPYSKPVFALAKSAAHMAVALFALTSAEAEPARRRAGVARLSDHITAALETQPFPDSGALHREIITLLEHCLGFARAASFGWAGDAPPLSQALQAQFASEAGPRILRITELATREQVAGLHAAAEAALQCLTPGEEAQLQVVVVGDHQARVRNLGMQYFTRRLHEQPGADTRVTYGENIVDEDEAISLVATRRLDRRIARAFFGDENRLQRDVLGDAAQRCLDQMQFPS